MKIGDVRCWSRCRERRHGAVLGNGNVKEGVGGEESKKRGSAQGVRGPEVTKAANEEAGRGVADRRSLEARVGGQNVES